MPTAHSTAHPPPPHTAHSPKAARVLPCGYRPPPANQPTHSPQPKGRKGPPLRIPPTTSQPAHTQPTAQRPQGSCLADTAHHQPTSPHTAHSRKAARVLPCGYRPPPPSTAHTTTSVHRPHHHLRPPPT